MDIAVLKIHRKKVNLFKFFVYFRRHYNVTIVGSGTFLNLRIFFWFENAHESDVSTNPKLVLI